MSAGVAVVTRSSSWRTEWPTRPNSSKRSPERLGDKKVAAQAVDNLVDIIIRTVNKGEKVNITGFGVFEKRTRAARTARNPRTGETVRVKKTNVPAFRAGTTFKEVVERREETAEGHHREAGYRHVEDGHHSPDHDAHHHESYSRHHHGTYHVCSDDEGDGSDQEHQDHDEGDCAEDHDEGEHHQGGVEDDTEDGDQVDHQVDGQVDHGQGGSEDHQGSEQDHEQGVVDEGEHHQGGEQEHRHQGHEGHQDHGGHGEEDSRQDHAGYGEDHAEDHREDDVADLSCEEDHYREEEVMPNAAPSGVRSFGGAFTI